METIYAQNLEEGMVVQGSRIVTNIEVGERWVWVHYADASRDVLPKFRLVRVVGNIYHTDD